MLFIGIILFLCYLNVKESFQKVIVGLNPYSVHCHSKKYIYLCIVKQKRMTKKITESRSIKTKKKIVMNKKNMILLSSLLVCSLESFAQNQVEASDSIWKDMDLDAVTVVASKPLVKMETDKMTYNVEQDADAKASTVLDMLRKVPMVTVDGQDNITVNGSSSFKVYVDGKPNPMFSANPSQIFKAMPATMVKNIEVITNPGAKYDAEGTGGVLNIVLNKQTLGGAGSSDLCNGYNGNISAAAGNQAQRISAFISGQQGKLTYSANGMYNYQKMNGTTISFDRTQKDGSLMNYYQKSDMKQPFSMGNISLSYELDSLSNISATAGLTTFGQKLNGHPLTQMSGGIYGKGFEYGNEMKQDLDNNSFNGSIDYQRFFNKERTNYLILSYLFSTNPTHIDNYTFYDDISQVTGILLHDLLSKSKTRGTEHTFQADFTHSLSETQRLNFGAKYIARTNKSDSRYYDVAADKSETLNPANSMEYKNNQSILAAYAEWKGNFGKIGTMLGTRYEQTWEKVKFEQGKGDDFDKQYGNFVPSASLSYNMAPGMNIGMNYQLRITRPGITYLNPYVDRSNPTAISYGNTDLDVVKSHQLNMVFNYYNQRFMLSTTLGYGFCDNKIEQYSFLDADNLLNTTYGNVSKTRNASMNVFINWLMFKKTRLMLNESLSYNDLRSDALGWKNNGWNSSTMINLQQTLPWELQWTVGSIIQTKQHNLQGYQSGMSLFYTTLSKSIVKDKLDLSLMFLTPTDDKLNIKQKTVGSDYVQNMTIKVPLRQISLTLTWKFGNTKKQFQQVKSNIKNDFQEEQQGIQTGGMEK